MVTILRGTTIEIDWKVVSAFTKQPIDFEGVEARLYLIAPDNKYVIPFEVERDAFRGLKATVSTEGLTTGVYDIKVIWLRDHLCHHHDYRNVSKKCSVFAITDNPMEVNYDESFIKIVTAVESFGRDGMSAYEIATFYGVTEDELAWGKLNVGDGLELGEGRELRVKTTSQFEFVDGALALSPVNGFATVGDVEERVAELVGSAPETLDTLGELAEAIEDNREVLDVLKEIAHGRDEVFVDSIGSRMLKFNGFRADDVHLRDTEVQADASSVYYHTGKKMFFASDAPIYPFAYYLGDNASHGSFTVSSALPPPYVKDVAYSIHNGFVLTDGRTLYIEAPLPEGYEYGGKKKYYVCGGVYYTWGNRVLVEVSPKYSTKFKLSNLVDSVSYAENSLIDQRYYDMVSGDMYAWEDGTLAVYTPSEGGGEISEEVLREYAKKTDIPTKVSQLTNDEGYAKSSDIPTKTSELTNDSGYVSVIPNLLKNTNFGDGFNGWTRSGSVAIKNDVYEGIGAAYIDGGGMIGQDVTLDTGVYTLSFRVANSSIDENYPLKVLLRRASVSKVDTNARGWNNGDVPTIYVASVSDKVYITFTLALASNINIDFENSRYGCLVDSIRLEEGDTANAYDEYLMQKRLVSGLNMATINGQSLLSGENITIEGATKDEIPRFNLFKNGDFADGAAGWEYDDSCKFSNGEANVGDGGWIKQSVRLIAGATYYLSFSFKDGSMYDDDVYPRAYFDLGVLRFYTVKSDANENVSIAPLNGYGVPSTAYEYQRTEDGETFTITIVPSETGEYPITLGNYDGDGSYDGVYYNVSLKKEEFLDMLPTKTSQLTNDSGYITEGRVEEMIDEAIVSTINVDY